MSKVLHINGYNDKSIPGIYDSSNTSLVLMMFRNDFEISDISKKFLNINGFILSIKYFHMGYPDTPKLDVIPLGWKGVLVCEASENIISSIKKSLRYSDDFRSDNKKNDFDFDIVVEIY